MVRIMAMGDLARYDRSFQRMAGTTAILGAIAAIASGILSLSAIPSSAAFDYWAAVLPRGNGAGTLLHFSMVLDVFGYYLLLAPLALFLWSWLRPMGPDLVRLYTICGLAYMLFGALGAAVLSAVVPQLMADYGHASGQQREMLQIVFNAVISAVDRGVWNTLEMFPAATWLLGIGWLLRRERGPIGIATMVVGGAALLDGVGTSLNLPWIALPGLGIFLAGLPLWALLLGIGLVRGEPRLSRQQGRQSG
jgi:hypothetical protein